MPQFETPEPISVVISLGLADVRVTASDRSDTTVEVRPSDPAERGDVSAAEKTHVEYAAGKLTINAPRGWKSYSPFSDAGSVDVEIGLPAGSEISGDAALARFHLTGALGDCRVSSVGDIHVDEAASVKLKTSAGDITLERAAGHAELGTSSGDIRVGEVDGPAVIKNSNGDTRVGAATADLRVVAANGDIAVGQAHGSLVAKTANGDIRLGAARRGEVVAETGYGAVEISVPEGTAAWLDVNTNFGHLHNGLDASAPPEPSGDSVSIRARTGYGDITIRRRNLPEPAGAAA